MTTATADLAHIPGAMERKLYREIPDGMIEYFEAKAGWLTQRGEPRLRPYRKYLWTPVDGEPVKLPSTSSINDTICPKPGVDYWSEERGIEGTVLALKAGLIYEGSLAKDAIAVVREHGLGAEAAKNRAAKRGLNLHAINQRYMETGEAPRLSDHPDEHRGYLRSWAKAMLALDPEPAKADQPEVEQLIVSPEDGYAGRLDLRARIRRALETCEMKTQERGGIYRAAHWQVLMYERGAVRCAADPAERCRVIVLPADGDWTEDRHTMLVAGDLDAALAYWRACRPIDSACEARNRRERKA